MKCTDKKLKGPEKFLMAIKFFEALEEQSGMTPRYLIQSLFTLLPPSPHAASISSSSSGSSKWIIAGCTDHLLADLLAIMFIASGS